MEIATTEITRGRPVIDDTAHRAADGGPVTERPEFVVSGDQQRVLQAVYDLWRPQARWPLYGPLDATMDHEHNIELEPTLATMPEDLMIFTRIPAASDDSEVKLTIAGISICDGGQADVDLFVRGPLVRTPAARTSARSAEAHSAPAHQPRRGA